MISATSDIETEFTIQARDVFKNPQIHGEDSFYINAIRQPIWTDSPIFYERDTVHIAKSHGQYRVRYTPKASGMYLLRIALVPPVGRHIATSRAVKAHKMLNATLGPRAVAESIEWKLAECRLAMLLPSFDAGSTLWRCVDGRTAGSEMPLPRRGLSLQSRAYPCRHNI